jgi:hypothetical protein
LEKAFQHPYLCRRKENNNKQQNITNNFLLTFLNFHIMKKNQMITIAAAALMLGLTGCNKEEATVSSKEGFQVSLSFKNSGTKADATPSVDGTTVSIQDGYLCFANAGNAITDVYTISNSPTAGKNIKNTDLGAIAVTLQGVPGSSVKVYMVVNKGTLATAPAIGNSVLSFMENYMTMTDQGDYTKVTSSGSATLDPTANADVKKADIILSTRVSRIQIEDIRFDGDIAGTVAGIFIKGFYPTMQLNGTPGTLTGSVVPTDYVDNSLVYTTALKTFAYDMVNKAVAATVAPVNGAWGYSLFTSATPQIIIKFTNVAINGSALANDQFVTVNGFKTVGGVNVATIDGGKIYTIKAGTLVIKPEHFSEIPGTTPIDVEVTVTSVTWKETLVIPNL